MWPILTLLLACGTSSPEVPEVTEDAAQTTAAFVRQCLDASVKLRTEGQSEDAGKAVLACYTAHFEPIEGALRAHNRKATLSLEYEFGRVAGGMAQEGSGTAAIGMAGRLADRVERVLTSLPVVPSSRDTGAK
jgi:hypothetical protein